MTAGRFYRVKNAGADRRVDWWCTADSEADACGSRTFTLAEYDTFTAALERLGFSLVQ